MTDALQNELELELDVDLDFEIPCNGLDLAFPDGSPSDLFECSRPATWQYTVHCCGNRTKFSCDPHADFKRLYGLQCAVCTARPVEVTWRKL